MSTPTASRRFARCAAHRRPIEHARAGQLAAEEQIGRHVEARNEVELLEDGGDAGRLRGARVDEPRSLAVDQHVPGVGLDHARENVHQGRLAGPVLAEQRMDLAAVEIEVDPRSAWTPPKCLTTPLHGEQRRRDFSAGAHRALAQEFR